MNYAFIPARSGSTRLADKNIRELAGQPLIAWTLQAAMRSDKIDKVIFSTDSIKYVDIAKRVCLEFEKELIIDLRAAEYAGTKSKIFDYLKGGLLDKFDFSKDDTIVQLLPTCPLRTHEHINEAVQLSEQTGQSVFAACEYDFHVAFAFSETENGQWEALLENSPLQTGNTQSQDQKTYLHTNGSINCLPISILSEQHPSIYYNSVFYKMPRRYSVDIDGIEDFELAELMLQSSKRDS